MGDASRPLIEREGRASVSVCWMYCEESGDILAEIIDGWGFPT